MIRREYPEYPIVGVGGVIFRDQSVLLVKRGQEPGKGQWSLPGGVVELGETLIEALKREVAEEVSIEIEVGGFVRVLDRILYDHEHRVRYHYVIADYWADILSGEPNPASDISDACFVPLHGLRNMGVSIMVEETVHMAFGSRQKNGD